ncbi:MAG: DUF3306 domain-containing protein [Roseococcus sp.]
MPTEEERLSFLSRWSRRKRGEELPEPEAPSPAQAAAPEPAQEPAPLVEAPPPEPEFDLASLPPIETLDVSSDFSLFLKPGVPQALRTAALRKAWVADPLIRDYMSPLDYAWDFNTPGGLPYGFSNVLAETGEALRKLISQAIGEIEPEEEKTEAIALAEAEPTALEGITAEDPPPEVEIPVTEAPMAEIQPLMEETFRPSRRRHGGAMPG